VLFRTCDFIWVTEFLDQKQAFRAHFWADMKGGVTPENLVAIPLEEFLQAVKEA
jgi:uncharacterized protein with GYD domain